MIGQVLAIVGTTALAMYVMARVAVAEQTADKPKKQTKRRPHKRPITKGGVTYTWN